MTQNRLSIAIAVTGREISKTAKPTDQTQEGEGRPRRFAEAFLEMRLKPGAYISWGNFVAKERPKRLSMRLQVLLHLTGKYGIALPSFTVFGPLSSWLNVAGELF